MPTFANRKQYVVISSLLLASYSSVNASPTDLSNVENNNLYELSTITVKGLRNNRNMVGKSIFNQDNLDKLQENNVANVLDKMPGVGMVGSPRPGGQKINIWGMSKSVDVPITVDGALKTFDKYRQGSVFIEPELIKQVTVGKGSHDASIGNGGFGGNVKLETKDASDFLKDDQSIGALVKYSRHSNNKQNTYSAAIFGQTDNKIIDTLFYFTKRDADNVKRPDGSKFLYSAYSQDSYLLKGNIRPTNEQKITWSMMQSSHDGWEPMAAMRDEMAYPTKEEVDKYGWDKAWQRKLLYRDQKDRSASLAYEYIPMDNELIDLKARITFSETKQHDLRPEHASNFMSGNLGNENWVKYKNINFDLNNTSIISLNMIEHAIKVGVQYQKMKQNIWMFDKSKIDKQDYNFGYYEPAYMPSGNQESKSIFLEDSMKIGNITITPSLRYDHIRNQGNGNILSIYQNPDPQYGQDYSKKNYSGFTPRLGLYWQANSNIALFMNYSLAWRAPTIDEQYTVQSSKVSTSGSSQNLDKEKMKSLIFGSVMNFNHLFVEDDSLQLRATFFHNRGKNEIFRNRGIMCHEQSIDNNISCPLPRTNYRNLTGYTIKGFELESFYNSTYVFAGLSFSTMKGMRDNSLRDPWFEQKTWLIDIPPRKATATLGFNIPQWNFSAGWRGEFIRRQDRSPSEQDPLSGLWELPKSKGYPLHSLFASWQPKSHWGDTKVNLTIANLFNKEYRPYLGEAVSGTGRDIRVTFSHQF